MVEGRHQGIEDTRPVKIRQDWQCIDLRIENLVMSPMMTRVSTPCSWRISCSFVAWNPSNPFFIRTGSPCKARAQSRGIGTPKEYILYISVCIIQGVFYYIYIIKGVFHMLYRVLFIYYTGCFCHWYKTRVK